MKDLHYLIQSLTLNERHRIRNSIAKRFANEDGSKYLQLFKLVETFGSKIQDNGFYVYKLYKQRNIAKFSMLKRRLLTRIVAIITSEENYKNHKEVTADDEGRYNVKRNLIALSTLRSRLAPTNSFKLLEDETERIAKKYDFKLELYEVLIYKSARVGFIQGHRKHEQLIKERELARIELENAIAIQDNYYRLILNPKYNNPENKDETIKFLEESIKQINANVTNRLAPSSEFIYLYLELEKAILTKDLPRIKKICQRQLSLINIHLPLQKVQRTAIVLGNLGYALITFEKYKEANAVIKKTLSLLDHNTNNYLLNQDIFFQLHLITNNLPQASSTVQILLTAPSSHGVFRLSKYQYNLGCLRFAEGRHKEALKVFGQKFAFHSDRTGYAIWVKIMQVLCLIEMGDTLAAHAKMNVLEKQFQRVKKSQPLSIRTQLIIRFLLAFSKVDFDPSRLKASHKTLLTKLKEKKQTHSWEPFTPELVQFHNWVGGKVGS